MCSPGHHLVHEDAIVWFQPVKCPTLVNSRRSKTMVTLVDDFREIPLCLKTGYEVNDAWDTYVKCLLEMRNFETLLENRHWTPT